MSLLDTLRQNPQVVRGLADAFGLSQDQADASLGSVIPALARGLQNQAGSPGGLEALERALETGRHDRYLDQPAQFGAEATRQDGNAILGHILGGKDVSRNIAGRASREVGVGSDILKKMLPVVATLAMGALRKGSASNEGPMANVGVPQRPAQQRLGELGAFLDADGDGSAVDDVLNLVSKFF